MSIDYQNHSEALELANQMQEENNLGFAHIEPNVIEADIVDTDTGEVAEE